ncbi:MAG: tetratricopeptide repeat protein [Gemmatimonadota bacterium]
MPTLWLALLCVASSATNLGNHYTQDDMPVIQRNPTIHTLTEPWAFFTQSYWPKPYPPALYRPFTSLTFAVEWALSGGEPWFYRATSILLYLAAGLAFYALLRRLVSREAAWIATALFMVHPVHVEAVAIAVNQSELMTGLLAVLAVSLYLKTREDGRFDARRGALLFALYLAACLYKESGLVIIGLLVAAELTVVKTDESLKARLRHARPLLLVMLLGAASFFAIRTLALGGDAVGTFKAEALDGLGMGQRALTMLPVVPHWVRLLLWPAHLQGDYSPKELEAATTWGGDQTLGLLILLLALLLAFGSWKKRPVVTLGIMWLAIGIFPVSNVLIPTGIMLAERTLFLPSIGMMLVVAGVLEPVLQWAAGKTSPRQDDKEARGLRGRLTVRQWMGAVVLGAILLMGLTRSASRQMVWRDQFTYWHQTTIDAPKSYRAHHALAQLLFQVGEKRWAETEYKKSIELYPRTWGVYFDLANKYRLNNMCEPATKLYQRTLLVEPEHEAARGALIACLLNLGRYEEAKHEAREGISYGSRPARVRLFQRFYQIADSAIKVDAKPGTVAIHMSAADTIPARSPVGAR